MKKLILLLTFASMSSFACDQKTFVKYISANKKWTTFNFESGLQLRLDHRAPMVPVLFNASLNHQKVCLTQVTRSSSGGIPNQVRIEN